jgi:hypothetical protein
MTQPTQDEEQPRPGRWGLVAVTWALVGIPLLWGVYNTLRKALALFE